MYDRETVRALVSAFNVHNYARNTVKTNFTLQSDGKKDYIVVSFDKSMDTYQCRRYLDSIKRKIIREFYGIEESNDAEILDTAKLIFDVNSFPFDISDRDWSWDKQDGFKFVTPVDQGVIFNLKSHLAASLAKDIIEGMQTCNIRSSDRKGYLWHGEFDNKGLHKKFESMFLSRMKARYENVPKNPLKVEGNDVYIKDVFNDARFIDSVTRYKAWLTGMDLGVDNDVDHSVKSFKNMIIRFTYSVTKVMIDGFILAPPLNGRVVSILTPITQNGKGIKLLTKEEVRAINRAFNNAVLDDISGRTQAKLSVNGSSETYGIDFSNKEISHCVITQIIENSVINKDHELSIDPELRFRALSPAQSPFNSPMHAGPSGIRTPPNQRRSIDSGISESPPKPKDSGSSSGGPSSGLTELSSPTQEFPTQSQDEELGRSPRRGSEREEETGRMSQLVLGEIDPSQPTCGQSQLSLTCRPPSIPFPIAWDNSISLNLGVSEDSPKDTENICNEEHKEQKVIGKSDRKSSDECSEAKSQDSKSPKKHGGGLFCKKGMPILAKLSPFKRRSVERDTMCSSKSDLVHYVTEKPLLSKRSASERRAKSNPPSKVTSPTHEGGSEWQQRLDPDQREELCKVLSPEMKEKLNSGFFLPRYEKLLHLLYVDSETLRSLLSTSERAEQVCSVLPPEKGKQLHSDLPFKTKKGLLFKFFDDEQEISRNVSTSSADSGCYSGSSSQKSTSDTGSDKDKLEASGGFSQSGRLSVSSSPSSKSVSSVIKKVRVGSLFSLEAGK